MTKVYTGASMSLDGYISGPNLTGFDQLFQWYGNGDVIIPTTHEDMTFALTPQSAEHLRAYLDLIGCLVVGRTLFDITNGWGGDHPLDRHVVVLTHSVPEGWEREGEKMTFVTEGGIERAIKTAAAIAGDKAVGVNGGAIARQCLAAGLLDEIWVDLVPVLLGAGTPFFDQLKDVPVELEGPVSVVEGKRVTHLRYLVKKPAPGA